MTELRKLPVSERGTVSIFGPGAAPLMDSNQAAQFLGVHPRTLQRMVLRGQITGVRVGKLWRFAGCCLAACPKCGAAVGVWCRQDQLTPPTANGSQSTTSDGLLLESTRRSGGIRSATRIVRGWTRPERQ